MRKLYTVVALAMLFAAFYSCHDKNSHRAPLVANEEYEDEREGKEEEENEEYDGPAIRDSLEFEKIKDPGLGYVPYNRLGAAIEHTERLKSAGALSRTTATMLWVERGPVFDTVGPSNGNTRAGVNYTSGRIRAVLVDTLNDPTGNTVFTGGVAGGLWRCTNFLSPVPNWQPVNDYFNNLAVSSICQDPSNPSVMYFATGEATSNADAVFGRGVWKSTNKGLSWAPLGSTNNFIRNYKILCDNVGNVYLAARPTTTPAAQPFGLLRSKDGGTTWTNITPTGLTSNAICTDIEISSTGKLHASFGYLGSIVNHRYTSDPANVTTTGWNTGVGIRTSSVAAIRMELAALADTLYAITVNTAYNTDSCYKSIDGGATWTKQNTAILPSGLGSGQGWYNLTLSINPANSAEIISGGLDAYRSTNSGQTMTRQTFWVTTAPYVHADHHFIQWWYKDGEPRVLIGCDGGLFLSRNGGTTWADKNRNLGIKQFYAAAIHPDAGSDYLIAGAQDNGTHQLKYPGLGPSVEVTGGDGCFVHINQANPQIQFASYVYNQYRRSVNGGATWSSVNLSTSAGLFVNPFDYDDAQNIMYASNGASAIRRWPNANTGTASTVLAVPQLSGNSTSFKVSPYTANRVFLGSNTGKVLRLENANTVAAADIAANITDISGAGFPAGFVSCINTGSSDNYLVAVFSNYGVNNVWYSTNAGSSWTAVDGDLPDMPVRWAVFVPGHDDQLILATEAGVYTTDAVNGASTVWVPNPGFPTVRTDMLKLRTSDNTVVAATHGRGLFTAVIPTTTNPELRFLTSGTNSAEETITTDGCRSYRDYTANIGIVNPPTGDATVTFNVAAGSTATRGVDFDFTTNGDFNSPSTTHVFTSGLSAVKTLTIRVYDDAEVESTENFTIDYTISGSTNAVAGTAKTHTFTITDNDRAPKPNEKADYVIGSYNVDLDDLNTPFDANKLKHRLQVLFSAAELKAAGFYAGGSISAMRIKIKTKNTTQPFKGFTISMANTGVTSLNTGFATATYTQVWTGDYSTVAGDNLFNFSTPFTWNGSSNVVVQFCFDNTGSTPEGVVDVVEGNGAPLGAGVRGSTYSNHTTATGAGCSLAAAFIDDYRLNATFSATFGNNVAATLNSKRSEYLGPNSDVYYYNAAGEILARVKSLSAHNYGCTQVTIDRAGTATSQFWNTSAANYLANKTYTIVPATNNTAGKYEVTFYYTKQEKEGWEAATGQSWNNIQLVKVPGKISNVTPLNAQPDGPGTVQVVTPVRGTYGTGYTLTYTFENGFSGYGAGIPGKMNTVLTLTGAQTGADIALNWTTSAEINSTVFELEKSYDGINFFKLTTVAAAGSKLSPSTYNHTDKENVQVNYYRVRLLHTDGSVIISNIVFLKNPYTEQRLIVLNNPFDNQIRFRLARVPSTPLVISLYDMGGKLVYKQSSPAGSGNIINFNINTTNVISKAIYTLDVHVDGKHYTARVLRK